MTCTAAHPLLLPAEFMLAGNAYFTVLSVKTGTRFTFRVHRADPEPGHANAPRLWFVSVLTGPDNGEDYSYLGLIRPPQGQPDGPLSYEHGRKSRVRPEAPSAVAARWVLGRLLRNLPLPNCEVYHEGRCGRCGRRLTVPESIESGYGPECISRL